MYYITVFLFFIINIYRLLLFQDKKISKKRRQFICDWMQYNFIEVCNCFDIHSISNHSQWNFRFETVIQSCGAEYIVVIHYILRQRWQLSFSMTWKVFFYGFSSVPLVRTNGYRLVLSFFYLYVPFIHGIYFESK